MQANLVRLTGIFRSMVSLFETGGKALSQNRAEKLGKVLDVGAEWLLTGDERNKGNLVDAVMVKWLKNHPEK